MILEQRGGKGKGENPDSLRSTRFLCELCVMRVGRFGMKAVVVDDGE